MKKFLSEDINNLKNINISEGIELEKINELLKQVGLKIEIKTATFCSTWNIKGILTEPNEKKMKQISLEFVDPDTSSINIKRKIF